MAEPKATPLEPDFLNAMFGLNTKGRKKRNLVWESDLAECEIGEYLIAPLTTSRQLRAEGRAMRHCVGNYDELCHKGRARVFSIRDSLGNRIATASLIWRDDYWHLEQIKGPQNAEVLENEETFFDGNSTVTQSEPTELFYIGQEILRRYRCAWSDRLHNYVCGLMKA
ncbi:PcfJ domain-containing protein [Methylococcus capsulatus]|uniref:PcfJ domain-containing protein n=1 Tax=Methylococcus capsulatus TaxID=414 RepID=UPI002FD94B93